MKENKIDFENFKKVLLDEKRIFAYISNGERELTEENLIKAITENENLKSLGFQLNPKGIIALAKSGMLGNLYNEIKNFYPAINTKPMYPNFPTQVLSMDEAQFRFHQSVHYFSTYSIEGLFGVEVSQGWLPTVEDADKIKEDITLLDAKVIEFMELSDVFKVVRKSIISKTERFTIPEIKITLFTVFCDVCNNDYNFTFKENLNYVFDEVYNTGTRKALEYIMFTLSKHTGDVLDYLDHVVVNNRYKQIPTSKKRAFVNVLESYSVIDFESNLVRVRERNITNLQYLSYNKLSKSSEHKEAIRRLRNKELRSWHSEVDKMIKDNKEDKVTAKEVIDFIGKRPSELLRMCRRLHRQVHPSGSEDVPTMIRESLEENVDKLSMQMLISLAKYSTNKVSEMAGYVSNPRDIPDTIDIFEYVYNITLKCTVIQLIQAKLKTYNTPFKNKKIYCDWSMYDVKHSILDLNDKMVEGGYIRSGLAIKIPENVKVLRFFTYWNDGRRIDIDLHGIGHYSDGSTCHIGWNSDYNNNGITHSGDITHSNAAEYIDIDLDVASSNDILYVTTNLNSFTGVPFKDIDTVFTGMMAVSKLGLKTDVELYNSKNVFFRHDLCSNVNRLDYAFVDIKNRVLVINNSKGSLNNTYGFTLGDYIDYLMSSQNVTYVENKEDADYIIKLDKPLADNEISLIDENYFIEQ